MLPIEHAAPAPREPGRTAVARPMQDAAMPGGTRHAQLTHVLQVLPLAVFQALAIGATIRGDAGLAAGSGDVPLQ